MGEAGFLFPRTFADRAVHSYVKVMEKIAGGKADHAALEHARLEKILKVGSTDGAKQDDMIMRQNILKSFL